MTWRVRPPRGPVKWCAPFVLAALFATDTRRIETMLRKHRRKGELKHRRGRVYMVNAALMARVMNEECGPSGELHYYAPRNGMRAEKRKAWKAPTLAVWMLSVAPQYGRRAVLVEVEPVPDSQQTHVLLVQGGQIMDNNTRRWVTAAEYEERFGILCWHVSQWWVIDRRKRNRA